MPPRPLGGRLTSCPPPTEIVLACPDIEDECKKIKQPSPESHNDEGVEPATGQEPDADCTDGYLVENIDEVSDASPGNFPAGESPIVLIGRSAIVVIPNTQCSRKHGGDGHPEHKLEVLKEDSSNSDIHHGKTDGVTPSSSVIVLRS